MFAIIIIINNNNDALSDSVTGGVDAWILASFVVKTDTGHGLTLRMCAWNIFRLFFTFTITSPSVRQSTSVRLLLAISFILEQAQVVNRDSRPKR